jgi:hypothetical protein
MMFSRKIAFFINRFTLPILSGVASGSVVTYMCMDAAHLQRIAALKQQLTIATEAVKACKESASQTGA